MKRRDASIGLAALAASQAVRAQRPLRVGWIANAESSFQEPQALAFVQRLAELGHVEGRNLVIERRHGDNKLERINAAAAELARLNCDVFFGGGGEASLAAMTQAHPSAPIVFVAVDFDPVATGDVASLAHPGGRVTGVTAQQSELPAKRVTLLREMLPSLKRMAFMANEQTAGQLQLVQGTARRLGIALNLIDLKRPPFDMTAAFAEASRGKAEALFMSGSGLWVPYRPQITQLALQARLPTMFHQSHWAVAGGLMSYGFNFPKMWRRGADMVVAVFKGGKPAEMPMEQPTEFELVLNMKTARTLGLKVPQTLLARADRLID